MGGRRWDQGWADSIWEERRKRVASSPKRAAIWMPIGRPLDDIERGREAAGMPVELKREVKPMQAWRAATYAASSVDDMSSTPSGGGGWHMVGERMTS